MDITLVTSSYDKVVHGTENEKKTACGINLLRPENVTRYHRTSMMTDLKEITCEKCKASLAKKMIKADKKEMTRLLKEEKQREKMGISDEGIVPLGNTTARITRDPDAKRKEEEARRKAAEEARKAAEEARKAAEEAAAQEAANNLYEQQNAAAEPEVPRNTIPGTGVAIDDSLAQFAINVPQKEEEAPAPAVEDDFLAQFAIQKPDAEPAQAQVQPEDDFLAQFAIPAPSSEPTVPQDIPAAYEEPDEMDGVDFGMQNGPAYGVPDPAVQARNEEDIMQMFSIDNPSADDMVYGQPVYGEPVYGEPIYAQPPVLDGSQQIIDADVQGYTPADGYQEYVQGSAWDQVSDQLFGADGIAQPISADEPAPVYPAYDENMPKEMDELSIPVIEDIAAPVMGELPAAGEMAAPILDDIPGVEDITASVLDEIPSAEEIAAPVIDDISSVEDIAAPVIDDIPSVDDIAAPVFDEIPAVEDIAAPVLDEIPSVEDIAAPVLDNMAEPTFNQPVMAEEEFETDMSDYNYVAPGRSAETNNTEQPKQAAAQQPQVIKVPQLAGYDSNNQPVYKYIQMRLAGYDQKGQPVYVPLQAAQNAARPQAQAAPQQAAAARPQAQAAPQQAAAPAQQTAAQAQRAAAAPAQPAAVKSVVPRKPVQQQGVPTANISKIAVNPHSKSTSQAFINAIASSKEYADKNLIETQGLKANSPVLTSVEDVLSTMGDDSVKRQKVAQAQQAVPVFDEYKTPARSNMRSNPAPRPQQPMDKDVRYMTKSELKQKKKQDKIEAKFRKEMSKRGF